MAAKEPVILLDQIKEKGRKEVRPARHCDGSSMGENGQLMVEMVKSALQADRKLVAILAADVVGYSHHMEQDEVATLEALSRLRSIADRLISIHRGRITGGAGDSFVAEFTSVLNAVECAVAIQEALAETNASLEEQACALELRVGVNVSDVMIQGRRYLW